MRDVKENRFSHDRFKILEAPSISQEWLKLELSNFVHRDDIKSYQGMINHPQRGRGYAHGTNPLKFLVSPKISLEWQKLVRHVKV